MTLDATPTTIVLFDGMGASSPTTLLVRVPSAYFSTVHVDLRCDRYVKDSKHPLAVPDLSLPPEPLLIRSSFDKNRGARLPQGHWTH